MRVAQHGRVGAVLGRFAARKAQRQRIVVSGGGRRAGRCGGELRVDVGGLAGGGRRQIGGRCGGQRQRQQCDRRGSERKHGVSWVLFLPSLPQARRMRTHACPHGRARAPASRLAPPGHGRAAGAPGGSLLSCRRFQSVSPRDSADADQDVPPPAPRALPCQRHAGRVLPAAGLLAGALLAGAPAQAAEGALRPWPATRATPALQLTGLDGRDWDLARLRGKVVLVNFWASWCAPCVDELPVLGALARDAQARGRLAVVGVNYKESLDTIERFTAAHPIGYPVLRDRSGEMFKRWTAGVMPTTILVDRQGRARWRSAGEIAPDDPGLKQAIAALLAEGARTHNKEDD